MPRLVKLLRNAALVLFWPAAALIVWGELTPQPPAEVADMWDKAEHFLAYLGLAAMITVVMGVKARLALAILVLVLLSGVLEILQGYTGRDPDVWDVVANALGALSGVGAAALALRLLQDARLVGAGRPE